MDFINKAFVVCFLCAIILIGGHHGVFAQNVDTTIKPLPDFIQDRPDTANDLPPEAVEETDNADDLSAPERDEERRTDLDDIPDEYIIEASEFADSCRNHPELSSMFDCRCMGVRYLDARIDLGPDVDASMVQNRLGGECKDATVMAGQLYEFCLRDIENAPTYLDPEEFCTCYANKYAEYFEDRPGRVTRVRRISMQAQAKLRCSDPTAAMRVYGPERLR